MSRICVKNLPKYVVEDQLKEYFSQKGEVTDAKLMRTKDGKSRQFGFVGFRTEEEAQGAVNFFNNSFFNTSRVTCEIARKIGDKDLPRPWSKYSLKKQQKQGDKGSQVNAEKDSAFSGLKRQEKKRKRNGEIDDPMLLEFLEVMKPHSTSQLWGNDTLAAASFGNIKTRKGEDKSNVTDAMSDLTDEEDDLSSRSDKEKPRALHDTGVSDMDYLKSKIKKKWSDSDSESDRVKINGFDKIVRLFITNLPYSATEEELEDHFSKFGDISEVHIVVDKETKRSKGFGYVRFSLPESAVRALKELNNSSFQGRLLHVERATEKISEKQEMSTFVGKSSKSFKKKREEERKEAESRGNTQAWNPFYMCSDTVVEYITRKYGVSKSDFLDKEADDLAVRTALAETQVIAETKKFLEKSGVNVTSLEELVANKSNNLKRSSHVILVKNLPFGSSESELAKMFGKFGELDKIIFPPTKTLALIIFLQPSDARAAFNGLWYKRYKDIILYLEWAPSNILAENNATNRIVVGEEEVERLDPSIDHDIIQSPYDKSSTKLIVKNIAFEATKKDIRQLFSPFGQIKRLKLPMRPGNHRGFAFVEFVTKQEAQNALQALASSTHFYRRRLVLERAKEDESLEELRKRTAAQFSECGLLNSAKMSKKRKKLGGFD